MLTWFCRLTGFADDDEPVVPVELDVAVVTSSTLFSDVSGSCGSIPKIVISDKKISNKKNLDKKISDKKILDKQNLDIKVYVLKYFGQKISDKMFCTKNFAPKFFQ
jgi:hypothetical protein